MTKITVAFADDLLKQVTKGDISFSRMVELLNETAQDKPEISEEVFDKWLIKRIGIQDVDIFSKGNLVREVAIDFAKECAKSRLHEPVSNEQSIEITDEMIEKWANSYEEPTYSESIELGFIRYGCFIGAKWYKSQQRLVLRDELIAFVNWYYHEQGGIDDYTRKYIDEYLTSKSKPQAKRNALYYCSVCHKVPVDAENGYDTCPDCAKNI